MLILPAYYVDFVEKRMNANLKMPRVNYARRKLLSELGELLGELTKHEAHGKPLDRENVLEELGDILFYHVVFSYKNGTLLGFRQIGNSLSDEILHYMYAIGYDCENPCIDGIFQVAETEFGYTIQMIIDANIEKLNKRPMPEEYYKTVKPVKTDEATIIRNGGYTGSCENVLDIQIEIENIK